MNTPAVALQGRRAQLALLAILMALVAFCYRDTLRTVGAKWFSDMTYSHGGLIVPIALWLVWRVRRDVAAVAWSPSAWGVAALSVACLAWLMARATGVLVVEQLAVVSMASCLTLAVLGSQAYRHLAFPLGFLLFAVPFGRGLVPSLMQVTADITVSALRLSGVPVLRNDMLLSIPAGDFEVARACSGLNYLMTGVVLGSLYAYLTYSGWRKRIAFVAVTVLVLVVANGIRAYLTVAVAHLSDMRYGTGYDHIIFGRALFLAVIVTMFWIGHWWRDRATDPVAPVVSPPRADTGRRSGLVAAACLVLVIGTPWYLSAVEERTASNGAPARPLIELPAGRSEWQGPLASADSWRPQFSGALEDRAAVYADAAGGVIELYVGVYELGRPAKGEMISYRNRLYAHENRSLIKELPVSMEVADKRVLAARELVIPDPAGARVVRYWFMVGDRVTTSRSTAKALEALALITGGAAHGRIVTLAAPAADEGARVRLDAFVREHGDCVQRGFDCGRGAG